MFHRLLLLFLLSSSALFSVTVSELAKQSYSIRSMGRGGASVAEPYGAEAMLVNPAGLAQVGGSLQYNTPDYKKTNAQSKSSTLFHRHPIGLGWWSVEQGDTKLDNFGIGYARRSRKGVDWGLTYTSSTLTTTTTTQSFWSADVGAILHLNPGFDVGFVGHHLLGTDSVDLSPSFKGGVLLKNKGASIKVYSDVVYDKSSTEYGDTYMRYGLDYMLSQDFILRAGADPNYITGGVSLDLGVIGIDYGIQSPRDDKKEAVYALGFKLGKSKKPDKFRRKYAMFKPNSIGYLEIDGALTSGYSSISLLGGKKIGSNDLIRLIGMANKDPDCTGFLIRVKSLDSDLTNIALVQEIRLALQSSKALGKKVYVYLDGWVGMPSYYLASVGDVVVMPPLGAIHELGIQFEVLKFDQLLAKLGVQFHTVFSGKHKTAAAPFSGPLNASQKDTIRASLENVHAQLKTTIRKDRKIEVNGSGPVFDGRIISASKAKEYGMIDALGFWPQMADVIREDLGAKRDVVLTHLSSFDDAPSYDYIWSPFNKIAVVEINGSILGGRSASNVIFGGVHTGSDDIAAIFKQLEKDLFLKGVVLRINSPGGSILASDHMLDAIRRFKEKTGKPVYTSMGTFAASGGYYVAMASDKIFANPATITGSIGVFTGFFNFHELEKKWGINAESLSTGKYMDLMSPHQPFTKEKEAVIKEHQQESYEHFKGLVQESRGLTDDEATALAQGQFMTGEQAKDVGLVDNLGSYQDTIKAMESDLGLSSSRVEIYGRPPQRNPFGFLSFLFN